MRAFLHITLGTALAGAGLVLPAAAQEDGKDSILLGTVTLTASGEPVALSRTGAAVSVITDEDVTRAGTLSFGQLVAQQPGVAFDASGGRGTVSTVRIRGFSGHYVGSRIDGFDVTDTAGTQYSFNFNTLGTSGLSRIEVLRGSQSALYGSEAIAGVIDVTTFRPVEEGVSGKVGVEAGTARTHTGELAAGLLTDRVELAFSASRTKSDGGFSTMAGGVEDDGYDISMASAYAAYQVTDTLRVGANLLWRKNFAEYDLPPFGAAPMAEAGVYSLGYQRGGRVFAELHTGDVRHEFAFSRLTNDRVEVSSPVEQYGFEGSRNRFGYLGHWQANEALSLNWGYEDTRETFVTTSAWSVESGRVTTRAIHAEALWSPGDALDLSLALRRDRHGAFGGKVTGRLAAAWRLADDWTLRAVAGTGFRAPSLYEMYSDLGDPGLKPETSRSLELGIQHDFASGATLQLTAFDMRIRDRIDYDPLATGCGSPWGCYGQIDGETKSRGVELSGRADIAPGWSAFGNYTYTDAHDYRAGGVTRAVRVPRHSLTLGVEGEVTERLSAVLILRHSGESHDPYGPLADYTLADVNLRYALGDRAEAYLRVENLFNSNYQTAWGYNQPGRQVFVGVRTAF